MTSNIVHQCDLCRVTVDDDKLADSHCGDARCPLNKLRLRARADKDARPPSDLGTILNAG